MRYIGIVILLVIGLIQYRKTKQRLGDKSIYKQTLKHPLVRFPREPPVIALLPLKCPYHCCLISDYIVSTHCLIYSYNDPFVP